MRLSTRDLVYVGVFGALWGVVEMTFGSLLHALNVPFSGAVLTGIGMTIALIGRLFVPKRGSVLLIGLVSAFLKMFSLGSIVVNPMIGIVTEALLAEIALSALGRPRRLSFLAAAMLALLWTFAQPFFTSGILGGQGLATVLGWTLQKGAKALGMLPSAVAAVLALLIGIHLLIGAVAGLLAWDAGRAVRARLQPAEKA